MRLFCLEFGNLLLKRQILLLWAVLWVFGQILFGTGSECRNARLNSSCREQVTRYEAQLQRMEAETALAWLKEMQKAKEAFTSAEESMEYRALTLLTESYEYLVYYPEYIQTVLSQAQTMERAAVFQRQGSFTINNIRKTGTDFRRLEDVAVSLEKPEWMILGTRNRIISYILLLQMIVCVSGLCGRHGEGGEVPLVKAQYLGKLPDLTAKLLCLMVCAVLTVVMMYAGCLVQAYLIAPGGSPGAAIQSFPLFQKTCLKVNVLTWLFLFLGCMVLALVLLAFLLFLCIQLLGTGYGISLFGAVYGSFLLLYTSIPDFSPFVFLKQVNPAAWLDVFAWMGRYQNVNLAGSAVSYITCFLAGAGLWLAVSAFMNGVVYCRNLRIGGNACTRWLRKKLSSYRSRLPAGTGTIVGHQLYLLSGGKRFLLSAGCVLLIVQFVRAPEEGYYFLSKASYNSYLRTVGGVYTEEAEDFLEREAAFINGTDGYLEKLERELEAGRLGYEEYSLLSDEHERDIGRKQEAFLLLQKQWSLVREAEEGGGGTPGFFNEYLAENLWNDREGQLFRWQLLTIMIYMLLVPFCRREARLEPVLSATCKGRLPRLLIRVLICLVTSSALALAVWTVWHSRVVAGWDIQDGQISVSCSSVFSGWSAGESFGEALCLQEISFLSGAVLSAVCIASISFAPLQEAAYYIVQAFFLEIPILLCALGVPAQYFSLGGCMLPYSWTRKGNAAWEIYLAAVSFAVVCLALVLLIRKYATSSEPRS